MSLNFKAAVPMDLSQPITDEELEQICLESDRKSDIMHKQAEAAKALPADGVKFVKGRPYKRKPKRTKKAVQQEEAEKIRKNNQVRKYTKEMQNRDAVVRNGRKLAKRAKKTVCTHDDKIAFAALAQSKRFDSLVYNSPTADVTDEILDNAFACVCQTADQHDEENCQ